MDKQSLDELSVVEGCDDIDSGAVRTRAVLDALPIETGPSLREPPLGSWASVARMMASEFPDDGFDWDSWKDQMKNGDY